MLGKIVLWAAGLIFTIYGIACLMSPELPAGYAGLVISNGDAYVEMGAMYGGLQAGLGLLLLFWAMRPAMHHSALVLTAVVLGSLGTARLYTGFDADWLVGVYTWGALAFELGTATLAIVALKRG